MVLVKAMARIVMKFGGTSVANLERIHNVARHVKREVDAGHEVAVVVSAMSGKTNELVDWVQNAAKVAGTNAASFYDAREYDAVVASGEQVTSGLLAITLQSMGINARSWQGWQIPIRTDNAHGAARILEIDGSDIVKRMGEGQVAVVAGFQGIGPIIASRRSVGAARTPRPSPSPRPSRRTVATSIPMSTASTPPTRASSPRLAA